MASDPDGTQGAGPSVVAIIAERIRMTEGQLYTAVIALAVALLLALTTIPSAHKLANPASPTPPAPAPSPAVSR
ncbi:MAG TPA: hypothetical protein VHV76_03925 [Mycobacteriales bacterium]|jgi:hypothetical protein|nr:hypothetical protein [Mycobacteriales bacterium]